MLGRVVDGHFGAISFLSRPLPRFIRNSFAHVDFKDANIVFMNSVTFPEELLEEVAQIAECLNPSARIVTAKTLLGPFKVIGSCFAKVSWSPIPFEYAVQQIHASPSPCEETPPVYPGEICVGSEKISGKSKS